MTKLYFSIIIIGIVIDSALLIFFNRQIAVYGPILFWSIGVVGMLIYIVNIFKLSRSVERTKPELYNRHRFGKILTREALSNKSFLSALNEDEQQIIEINNTLFKYQFICFMLFGISAILIFLK